MSVCRSLMKVYLKSLFPLKIQNIAAGFKVLAADSPPSLPQPSATLPPPGPLSSNQGQLDSLWTSRPVLSSLRDPSASTGEKYCSKSSVHAHTHTLTRRRWWWHSGWRSSARQTNGRLSRCKMLLWCRQRVQCPCRLADSKVFSSSASSSSSLHSRLSGKVLHFQPGEAGWVQKSFWSSKWKDIQALWKFSQDVATCSKMHSVFKRRWFLFSSDFKYHLKSNSSLVWLVFYQVGKKNVLKDLKTYSLEN